MSVHAFITLFALTPLLSSVTVAVESKARNSREEFSLNAAQDEGKPLSIIVSQLIVRISRDGMALESRNFSW